EFIISKMQNPRILRYLIENTKDEQIKHLAKEKLKFTPLTEVEADLYQGVLNYKAMPGLGGFTPEAIKEDESKLRNGGTYGDHEPDFLTGANISDCIKKKFMEYIHNDDLYERKYRDEDKYK